MAFVASGQGRFRFQIPTSHHIVWQSVGTGASSGQFRGPGVAHIIVVGNEKGGAGKSTIAMHVATALARMEHRVWTLDLDLRQQSLGRYLANRRAWLKKEERDLPVPGYMALPEADPVVERYLTAPIRNWRGMVTGQMRRATAFPA